MVCNVIYLDFEINNNKNLILIDVEWKGKYIFSPKRVPRPIYLMIISFYFMFYFEKSYDIIGIKIKLLSPPAGVQNLQFLIKDQNTLKFYQTNSFKLYEKSSTEQEFYFHKIHLSEVVLVKTKYIEIVEKFQIVALKNTNYLSKLI